MVDFPASYVRLPECILSGICQADRKTTIHHSLWRCQCPPSTRSLTVQLSGNWTFKFHTLDLKKFSWDVGRLVTLRNDTNLQNLEIKQTTNFIVDSRSPQKSLKFNHSAGKLVVTGMMERSTKPMPFSNQHFLRIIKVIKVEKIDRNLATKRFLRLFLC